MKTVGQVLLWIGAILLAAVVLLVLTVVIVRQANRFKNRIWSENGIQESTYIDIGGMKQYIQIRGENVNNPVMIFIHGGPASPMGFVSTYYQKPLESELTIINYDQRGCGRTYYANDCDPYADIDLILEDLDGIVDYARDRFGQEKVILTGHSWGSAVGSLYAQQHPEKVSCYIGVGQMTDGVKDKLSVAEMALEDPRISGTEDEQELTALVKKLSKAESLEGQVFSDMQRMTVLSAKYARCDGIQSGLGQIWSGLSSPDMNLRDMRWFLHQLTQLENNGFIKEHDTVMNYAMFGFKTSNLSPVYEVPVFYIAGEGDFVVCQRNAKAYLETITAPDKGFYELKNTGHSPFMDDPETYCDTVKSILNRIGN